MLEIPPGGAFQRENPILNYHHLTFTNLTAQYFTDFKTEDRWSKRLTKLPLGSLEMGRLVARNKAQAGFLSGSSTCRLAVFSVEGHTDPTAEVCAWC